MAEAATAKKPYLRRGEGRLGTSLPTAEGAPWVVQYNVRDLSGNPAQEVQRPHRQCGHFVVQALFTPSDNVFICQSYE